MEKSYPPINVTQILLLKTLTLVVPLLTGLLEAQVNVGHLSVDLFAKWFLFSAVGIRLLIAGFRSVSWLTMGLGLFAILAAFFSKFMVPAALVASTYFLITVIRQAKEIPSTFNEWMLILTDTVVFLGITTYLAFQYMA